MKAKRILELFSFRTFGIFGLTLLALALSLNGYSQVGPVGTRTISRAGAGTLGNPGDIQIGGPSPQGNGPLAAVSGFNFNWTTGVFYIDSVPITNVNNYITLDTTSATGDTVTLLFGYNNIILNRYTGTIHTVVVRMGTVPANVLALTGNQADNFRTTVKWSMGTAGGAGNATTYSVVQYTANARIAGYSSVYTALSSQTSDFKTFVYSSVNATYY